MSKDSKITRQNHQLKPPVFPGGKKGLDEYIKSNLRYPEEAVNKKIEGIVAIDYDVDVYGHVSAVKVKHGIGYGCDEEAVRLVTAMKFQKRIYPGQRVVFHQKINIHFRLNTASKPIENTTAIQYTFKPTAPEKPETPAAPVYTIRVDL
jgi:TonB family protein